MDRIGTLLAAVLAVVVSLAPGTGAAETASVAERSTGSARGQDEAPAAVRQRTTPVFGEAIEVRVVEVEVVVTDPEGARVHGLERDDFRLFIGGREVPIEYFDERRDGARVQRPPDEPGPPVDDSGNTVDLATDGIRYLLFLDDFFTDRRYRGAVLDRAVQEVDQLRPGDQMAVVRFRGRGLEVLQDWTASRSELASVLAAARKAPTWELRRQARLSSATNPANRVRIVAWQIEDAQKTLTSALRAFAGAPGRKVLLLFSSGWPVDLPRGSSFSAELAARRLGGGRLMRPVTDTANLLGYTIYTFHLGGLGRNPTAADRGPSGPGRFDPGSLHSLHRFAAETGGRSFAYATMIPRPLSAVAEDTANYYTLGFRAQMVGDGRLRPISVRVTGQGLEARHRRGYRDLTAGQRAELEAEAALFSGTSEGEPLDVDLGEPKGGLRAVEVPFTVRIPMDWAIVLPTGNGRYSARLELRVAALDKVGDRSEITALPIQLDGPRPAPGSHSVFDATVRLRRKKQRVVFTLSDPLRGESLTSTVEFDPRSGGRPPE